MALILLFLYFVGSAQSFLEVTLVTLYTAIRWVSWVGFLGSLCLLVPGGWNLRRRRSAALVLALAFALVFGAAAFWGSWIHPGVLAW